VAAGGGVVAAVGRAAVVGHADQAVRAGRRRVRGVLAEVEVLNGELDVPRELAPPALGGGEPHEVENQHSGEPLDVQSLAHPPLLAAPLAFRAVIAIENFLFRKEVEAVSETHSLPRRGRRDTEAEVPERVERHGAVRAVRAREARLELADEHVSDRGVALSHHALPGLHGYLVVRQVPRDVPHHGPGPHRHAVHVLVQSVEQLTKELLRVMLLEPHKHGAEALHDRLEGLRVDGSAGVALAPHLR